MVLARMAMTLHFILSSPARTHARLAAYVRMANYFTDLNDLDQIDWPLLNSRDFRNDPDDPGKMERYRAEALVWKRVPLEGITGICCYTAAVDKWVTPNWISAVPGSRQRFKRSGIFRR